MNAGEIAALSLCIPVLLGVVLLLIHINVEHALDALWPRGLRWFPGAWMGAAEGAHRLMLRIFWPERLPDFKSLEVLRLESHDQTWRLWAQVGAPEPPRWEERPGRPGHWEPYCEAKHGEGSQWQG